MDRREVQDAIDLAKDVIVWHEGFLNPYAVTIWVDGKSIVEAAGLNLLFEKGMLALIE
ncbi:hypothetical protein [Hydrogenibacillus schlegelii]|uniref:hypothetical protein n=1 Tax=Hydrogenibacillus schlegelii TaxID=1484 RepID=UPI0023546A8B|nr:hypothetical protein [Hydrogenibacillus schlegelii]